MSLPQNDQRWIDAAIKDALAPHVCDCRAEIQHVRAKLHDSRAVVEHYRRELAQRDKLISFWRWVARSAIGVIAAAGGFYVGYVKGAV